MSRFSIKTKLCILLCLFGLAACNDSSKKAITHGAGQSIPTAYNSLTTSLLSLPIASSGSIAVPSGFTELTDSAQLPTSNFTGRVFTSGATNDGALAVAAIIQMQSSDALAELQNVLSIIDLGVAGSTLSYSDGPALADDQSAGALATLQLSSPQAFRALMNQIISLTCKTSGSSPLTSTISAISGEPTTTSYKLSVGLTQRTSSGERVLTLALVPTTTYSQYEDNIFVFTSTSNITP